MADIDDRIVSLDLALFDSIPTQTSSSDRTTLLLLQNCAREGAPYVYLEIGSHLGGTIAPHYADPCCRLIYSIDKRPSSQPDERGEVFTYDGNSTATMLANLRSALPNVDQAKVKTFDCDASELDHRQIVERPSICFIDGEHTDRTVVSDFEFCLAVAATDAVIAFHDTCFVFKGIERIKRSLTERSIRYRGMMLGGAVYAILLNKAVDRLAARLEPHSQSEATYFRQVRRGLWKIRVRNRYPTVYGLMKWGRNVLMSLTNRRA